MVDSAAKLVKRSFKPANEAIQRLVDAAILPLVNVRRRNRAYEAPEIIAAFTSLELQLANPEETPGGAALSGVFQRGASDS
jgi:molybdenum-dependent DNA-binding transcriptional regulator ModE